MAATSVRILSEIVGQALSKRACESLKMALDFAPGMEYVSMEEYRKLHKLADNLINAIANYEAACESQEKQYEALEAQDEAREVLYEALLEVLFSQLAVWYALDKPTTAGQWGKRAYLEDHYEAKRHEAREVAESIINGEAHLI